MTINVQVDTKRAIEIKRDAAGNIVGAEVREQDSKPKASDEA